MFGRATALATLVLAGLDRAARADHGIGGGGDPIGKGLNSWSWR